MTLRELIKAATGMSEEQLGWMERDLGGREYFAWHAHIDVINLDPDDGEPLDTLEPLPPAEAKRFRKKAVRWDSKRKVITINVIGS